jgi:O-antigen ligase
MGRGTRIAVVVASAAVVAQSSTLGTLAPIVVGVVLVGGHLAAWAWSTHRSSTGGGGSDLRRVAPLVVAAWLATSILPVHSFSARSSASAVSAFGIQPVLELLLFSAVGLLALAIIRTLEPSFDRARPPLVLFLLPVWIIASSTWSDSGLYAWVRGMQMATIALLAWATLALGRADRSIVDAIIEGYLRWFVRVTAVLVAVGFAFGPMYVVATAANLQRFTWIGAHPNGSGLVLSAAIVIVLATPPSVLRLPRLVLLPLAGVLLAAMYGNHSRAAWACLALGLLTAFALQGHLNRFLRWTGTPALGAAAVAAVYFRGAEIWDYLLRDRGADSFAGGSGRRELWGIGFRSLDTAFDWVAGLGYGAARSIFLEEAYWAGEAHNSVLSLLVSVGLVGVALLLATLGWTILHLAAGKAWATSTTGVALIPLLVLVVVNGMATDILAEPTIGFVVLNLVAVVALVHRAEPRSIARRPAAAVAVPLAARDRA